MSLNLLTYYLEIIIVYLSTSLSPLMLDPWQQFKEFSTAKIVEISFGIRSFGKRFS